MLIDKFWLVQKKCVPLMLLRGYRAAELRVNMLKDNIEMDIKGISDYGYVECKYFDQYTTLRSPLSSTIFCRKR